MTNFTIDRTCQKCRGQGWFRSSASRLLTKCPACRGTGMVPLNKGKKIEIMKLDAPTKKSFVRLIKNALTFLKAK